MLDIRGLVTRYGNIEALHGVSLTLQAGEILTLIGANGAGKTTLLRTITGLVPAFAGEILFEGKPLPRRAHERVRLGLSMAPEGRKIFARMTVLENLEMGAFSRNDASGIAADQERVLGLFPRLRERLTQLGGTLSGGEQQMLAIARALMARPRLLLLDEPSLGLAPMIVTQIFEIIKEINGMGMTVLLVEQNAAQALRVGHRAYVLETGKVVMEGPSQELAADPRVREAYLGL